MLCLVVGHTTDRKSPDEFSSNRDGKRLPDPVNKSRTVDRVTTGLLMAQRKRNCSIDLGNQLIIDNEDWMESQWET